MKTGKSPFGFRSLLAILSAVSLIVVLTVTDWLYMPVRDLWQRPGSVVRALNLKSGDKLADIGASSGYFSLRFSPAVGAEGRIYAVDTDIEALGRLARRTAGRIPSNIDTVHARPDDPLLPEKVDLAFFCHSLHHINHQAGYLRDLKRHLAPGARLAVIEFRENSPVGPRGEGHRLSRERALGILRDAGFRTVEEFAFLPFQYFLVATPD